MNKLVLRIPNLNETEADYDRLFEFQRRISNHFGEVVFDFTACSFLKHNAVAFLGGLGTQVVASGSKLSFSFPSGFTGPVFSHLSKNGFLSGFGISCQIKKSTAVPYRRDVSLDKIGLMAYLKNEWLSYGRVNLSEGLRSAILGTAWEIYENAFGHSQSTLGIFSCGQYYPNLKMLELSVVDFGLGIPSNVRSHHDSSLDGARSLEWAFQPGATTTREGVGRGMGLDILKGFIKENNGTMYVYSNDGHVMIAGGCETYSTRSTNFTGTVVNITFMCDEKKYMLSSEVDNGPLFF